MDEFNNTQQSDATDSQPSHQIQEPVVQAPVSVSEPVQVVDTTAAPIPKADPEVKTRKKWFGLFGPQIPVGPPVADTVVAQPVTAEPVVAEAVVVSSDEDEP